MEQSALKLAETETEAPSYVTAPPIQHQGDADIIDYASGVSVAAVDEKLRLERLRRRRRKLALFIKMETIALFFLALALTGATSEVIRQLGLRSEFKLGLLPAALAVAVIPVIFFGLTSQEYRYRSRRNR